jgi:hypothetical protein
MDLLALQRKKHGSRRGSVDQTCDGNHLAGTCMDSTRIRPDHAALNKTSISHDASFRIFAK